MSWFSKKDVRETKVNEIIDRALKSQVRNLLQPYTDLEEFIPDYSNIIMKRLAKQFTQVLSSTSSPLDVQGKMLDLLVAMIDKEDPERPETEALRTFSAEAGIIPALFLHTRNIDVRIIHIMDKMFLIGPLKFIKHILASEECMMPLIQAVALSQNVAAGRLLHRLALSNPKVLQLVLPSIKPQLRKYPAGTVIDFMVTSSDLLDVIPKDEIESWLFTHQQYSVFDVQQVFCNLHPFLWKRSVAVYLLDRTDPPECLEHVAWIHDMPPQDLTLSEEEARFSARHLLHPFPEEGPVPPQESQDAHAFIRLFTLSMSNPKDASPDVIAHVLRRMTDKNDWIAAAATQVVFMWMLERGFKVENSDLVFILAAAAVDREGTRQAEVLELYKAMLHVLGEQHNVAVTILMSEKRMRFDMKCVEAITEQKWAFPHLKRYLDKIPNLELINYQDACRVLGYVMDFLNVPVNPDEEPTSK